MTGLLAGAGFLRRYADRLAETVRGTGLELETIAVPEDPAARVDAADVARVELAYFSGDVYPDASAAFFAAALGAEELSWLHCFNAGTDHPVFRRVAERGAVLTNSPGANALPIAHSAVAGLLALARDFPRYAAAQRERRWLDAERLPAPRDLAGQTLLVVGLGGIGTEIARLGRALGMRVVGVRRSSPPADAPVDEHATPDRLAEHLPRADWLALACPLTEETRGLVDAGVLAALPRGARLLNVARGEIVDEAALARALREGHLAGAYLDVFESEPLPPESPFWELANVIVTPHAAARSDGSEARQAEIFLANLARWARGEPLAHVVAGGGAGRG